ncbi:HXXEE domain-containing protein [Paenibacillus segetis]|uniref:Membrane protein n=1 Tax=Paenibacillus segetis TaxID=1325360 RepID=A0ABQ1YFJ7_9BACL|nr:HXXEE domain-containing protein [Paenibacillus segetis]GGH22543.1 membrane protein [Paenibacillus segetis]
MINDPFITIHSVMWLFLAVFMIHDFEEIIFVEYWMKRNYPRINERIPAPARRLVKNMSEVTSAQFAVAVALEFIVFIPVTYLAVEQQNYLLFIGFNALLLVHVFTHLGQSILLRAYTPGVVTALLFTLPYSLYLFYRMINDGLVSLKEVLYYAPTGLILLPIVLLGHKLGKMALRE